MRYIGSDELDYQGLSEFRHQLRLFLRFSEDAARAGGLEPQHHQLLLALKGLPEGRRATVAALAERLQLRHHSVVGLVDRLERRGLVRRRTDELDHRRVEVAITPAGEGVLRRLARAHTEELRQRGPELVRALEGIAPARRKQPA